MEQNNSRHSVRDSINVFDDEFAVDDSDLVADGFAPGRIQHVGNDSDGARRGTAMHGVAAHTDNMDDMAITPTPSAASRFRANRSSIRKSRDADNPFRSVEDDDHDDSQSTIGRSSSIRSQSTVAYAPGNTHRSVSSISSRAFAPTHSPVQGINGPSHPYAMYPQGTALARTASASTTSTIRPQRPLMDQHGPAHPYAMYPQDVSEDLHESDDRDPPASHAQAQIPVGFPGRTQPYQRQRGPDGEEHDLIGIDGHAEQLPPYSEYPEEGAPKHIVLPAEATTSMPSNPASLNIPLMPQRPQSMSDAPTRAGPQLYTSLEEMESNDSGPPVPKRWREKTWKEKRKTKFCGIPFWWILLSLCVLAFIAAVLGGAIGGFMSSQNNSPSKKPHHLLPSSTSLYDASPIPTSSSGSPPPTGTYALTLGSPEAVQSACLIDQDYNLAWSCDMAGPQSLGISIQDPPSNAGGWQGATLLDTSADNGYSNISYGTQTPTTSFSQFIAVTDNDDPDQGPAFYFQAFYDKVVVAPPNAFASAAPPSTTSSSKKRDGATFNLPSAWYTRHQIAAGEQPWFCFWNGTFIEGFIYSTNNTEEGSSSNTSSAVSSTAPPSASTPSTFTTTSTILEVSGPSTTSTVRMASPTSDSHGWSSSATHMAKRFTGDYYNQIPQFNYLVKIEERRIAGSPQPYCQKMQILDDGTAGIVSDPSTGSPIRIPLGENDPSYSSYPTGSSSSRKAKRSATVPNGCHCQWWSGE